MGSDILLIIIALLCVAISIIFLYKLKPLENKDQFLWLMPYNALVALTLFCGYSVISLFYLYISNINTVSRTAFFVLTFFYAILASISTSYISQKIRFAELLGEDTGPKVTLPSKLKRGNTYLIKDLERKRAFRLFSDSVGLKFEGLAITRQNPKNIIRTFDLKKARVIWLTEIKNGKNLSPTDLEEISYVINNFVTHSKRSIILFDGFEYLSDYNNFNKVLHLFQVLKDNISMKKSILLLYINPRTMEKKNLKLLENEFKVI